MSDTSASLLDRLRTRSDAEAWQRMIDLYSPLIRSWLRRHAAPDSDIDDLVQETLAVAMRKMPQFEHNQRVGAFRHWLRMITVNCLRDFWRAQRFRPKATGDSDFLQVLHQLEDSQSGLSRMWDQEHDLHVTRRLLDMLQPQFEPKTWRAFELVSLEEVSADAAAKELGLSVNAVYIAKSRVLARLRQEARGLVD